MIRSMLPSRRFVGAAAGPAARFHFRTLDNRHDRAFNRLLDINNKNQIAGFFGAGGPGHPNKGYRLAPPSGRPTTRA